MRYLLLALALILYSCASWAADPFDQYVQSIDALEQAQAGKPGTTIRYSAPQDGNLAKAVLDPARALPMVDFFGELQKQGIRRGDLPNLLQPALSRYERAFADDPAHYEREYLDSLDLTVALRMQTRRALAAAREEQAAHDAAHGVQGKSSLATFESLERLAATADKSLAAAIRQDVRHKKYSAEGAKRALQSAAALEVN
jgi:hypothetical protein